MRAVEPIIKFDLALSSFCLGHRFNLPLAKLSRLISHTGDGHLYLLIGLIAWALDTTTGVAFFKVGILAFIIELPIYWVLKNGFRRRRPYDRSESLTSFIQPADQYSLPSGHTAAGFLMATLIASFYPQYAIAAYGWAAAVSASRIFLGVHFFTDIVIGAGLGIACAKLALMLTM
ncbi:phosphatase PAP2 family protein [Vibrio coralliilyticus]|uniref:phosphatase PAP2 family protein n=1 Tax=Vibrio coralliilyticus TaxID=190893 RepID=UPI0005129053|nr:phosphatase PAP2 family protein [Vibrio coralliilyticus]AIU67868.1 membrane protein [Vibrio coralliilyticus]NRF26707.1 phosphatase PAP2 family protein [Vibrio coralliilyticus]NRF80885.1 phosphatase PAP2 family protein [Vibrio coralliilyticus]